MRSKAKRRAGRDRALRRADRRRRRRQRREATARQAQESGRIVSRMQPAIIRGERRMLRIVNVPLSTGAVAGFAVDVQDLEDARAELARHIESQRELADRMTAGTAQFDADRTLSFFNRPFAVMTQLDPEWLAEKPEFDRVIERMRDNQRLARSARLSGVEGRAARLVHQRRGGHRGRMDASQRRPPARGRPAAPGRRPAPVPRGPHRAAAARLGPRHVAARSRRDVRQSVRSDQRVRERRTALSLEPPLPRGLGARRGMAHDASARRRTGAGDGPEARQSDGSGRADPRDGPPDDQRAAVIEVAEFR